MAVNIGKSYAQSIGRTYINFPHAPYMQAASKKTFWERVVEALHDMGIDEDQQTVVAKLIKIKQPSVWEWTDGGEPSMKNARLLALALNVCVDWLLTGRGDKHPIPSDPEAQELWELWCRVPGIREKVLAFAKFEASHAGPFDKNRENAA